MREGVEYDQVNLTAGPGGYGPLICTISLQAMARLASARESQPWQGGFTKFQIFKNPSRTGGHGSWMKPEGGLGLEPIRGITASVIAALVVLVDLGRAADCAGRVHGRS